MGSPWLQCRLPERHLFPENERCVGRMQRQRQYQGGWGHRNKSVFLVKRNNDIPCYFSLLFVRTELQSSGKYVKGMLLQIEKVSFLTAFIFSLFLYQHFTGIYIHGLKSPVYVYQIHISRFENKEQHRY